MKQYIFGKKIKFTMLVSIIFTLGIQASYGVAVYCPQTKYNEIKERPYEGGWIYSGIAKSKDSKISIPMKSFKYSEKQNLSQGPAIAYIPQFGQLYCQYGEDIYTAAGISGKNERHCIVVEEDGHPTPHPAGPGDHFDCLVR
jgi:hypothetical protein